MDRAGVLKKVRGLLAKADSTEFSAERDALREKADNLMLKFAIEEAELASVQGRTLKDQVIKKRILIVGQNSPYREALGDLFSVTARHARCRIVFHGYSAPVRNPLYGTMVGMESDVEYAEMLFTSLKMQVANELEPQYDHGLSLEDNVYIMRHAGLKWRRVEEQCGLDPYGPAQRAYGRACEQRGEEPRKRVNPKTVKRNFVEGFVARINARLREIRKRQEQHHGSSGNALVLVRDAVGEAYEEMFPDLKLSRSRQSGKIDVESWMRGQRAGDRADLGQSRMREPKRLP